MSANLYRKLYIRLLRYLRKKSGPIAAEPSAHALRAKGPKTVVIGGGTGLSTLLRGLKKYTQNITAVVTVADDGGGSGRIRQELGMPPPGDIRNCLLALANTEPTMKAVLNYRFSEGTLEGQSFGNLFLAALNGVYGSFDEAVRRMNEVLAVTGRVLPVSTADVNLKAEFEDGSEIVGESRIFHHKKEHDCRIRRVSLVPEGAKALPQALHAIEEADLVVLGPGSLYTSVIPNLLFDGVVEALQRTGALRVFVLNVMTQDGETEGYSAADHLRALEAHGGAARFLDLCLANTSPVGPERISRYAWEGAEPIYTSAEEMGAFGLAYAGAPLIAEDGPLARHDPDLLARTLVALFLDHDPAFPGGPACQKVLDEAVST